MENLRVLELYGSSEGKGGPRELWKTDNNTPVQLRELIIRNCLEFQRFPKSIGRLKHLVMIVVQYTKNVRSLAEEFCLLQSLEHLILTGSWLSSLEHFNLSHSTNLRILPVTFKELRLLQNLTNCTTLTLESDIMENMMKLEYLNLSHCLQLEELPRHIINQAFLTKLNLTQTKRLREIPVNIGQLSKLQELSISSELLASLPTSLGDLPCLTSLEISNCPKMECLSDSLGCLNLLLNLSLSESGVKSLPKSVKQLSNLQTLKICCPIGEVDLGAGLFTSLERIEL